MDFGGGEQAPGNQLAGLDVGGAQQGARFGAKDGDVAALGKLVATREPGKPMSVEVKDVKGVARKVDLDVVLTPRLIGLSDQTVLFNRALVDLRAQLAATSDPFRQSVIRLNTAVALARLGECAIARDELKQVQLPDRPGVGNGTVQYLLGVCAEALGNRAEAEAAKSKLQAALTRIEGQRA